MKKIWLITLLVIGGGQLKAQQFFQAKPADTLSKQLFGNKLKPDNSWQVTQPQIKGLLPLNGSLITANAYNSCLMPVAVLPGYSKMPVLILEGDSKMPVKYIGPEEAALPLRRKTLTLMPAFTAPEK